MGYALSSRMMHRMKLFQSFLCHMGVYLGSGQITVPQQQLNHPQICTMIYQVGGKSVAQGMG